MKPIQNKIILENWKPHDVGNVAHLYFLPKIYPRQYFLDADAMLINVQLIDFFPVYLILDMFGRKPINRYILNPTRDETPFYYFTCNQ